jgi:alpha-galactosidase/6-phospho-beta-glucosidase family protein
MKNLNLAMQSRADRVADRYPQRRRNDTRPNRIKIFVQSDMCNLEKRKRKREKKEKEKKKKERKEKKRNGRAIAMLDRDQTRFDPAARPCAPQTRAICLNR